MTITSSRSGDDSGPVPAGATPGRLRLVNADPRYERAHLIDPSPAGFVHVAVQTAAQRRPGPVLGRDARREQAVAAMSAYGQAVLGAGEVREAAVFRAALVAPAPKGHVSSPVQPDVALLVETATPGDALALAASAQLRELLGGLRAAGARAHVLAARNARRIADVNHRQGGLFLFNHFFADDEGVALALWERLAAWYEREAGLRNSVLLAPAEGWDSAFALVNHARFDASLPRLALHQFAKRSFFSYVRANLRANGVAVLPALYRVTWAGMAPSAGSRRA
ncbi:MAG: hypothetical protein ACRDYX_12470 [Egibacteraceae bacterium]